jgi:uncharacterized membrane protein YcfT
VRDKRIEWVDRARGIGIVLVVLAHVQMGLVLQGLISPHSGMKTLLYVVYTFHMPLFFFLAGLFAPKSIDAGQTRFWRNKAQYLVWPYLFWAVAESMLQSAFGSSYANAAGGMPTLSLLWAPPMQFWFLYALFFCHLTYATIRRLGFRALFGISVLAFATVYFADLPDIVRASARGLLYYALGVSFAGFPARWSPRLPAAVGLVTLFGAAAAACFALGIPEGAAIPSAVVGIAATVAVAGVLRGPVAALISRLGALSMSIYVMHVVASAAMRVALERGLGTRNFMLHLLVGTVAGIFLPLVAHYSARPLGLLPWLGLRDDIMRATGARNAGPGVATGPQRLVSGGASSQAAAAERIKWRGWGVRT